MPVERGRRPIPEWQRDGVRCLVAEPRDRIAASARRTFGIVSALLPKQVADEELGDDVLEDIDRRIADRRPAWEVRLKIGGAVFWAFVRTLLYLLREVASVVASRT
jgi:hypothetical protein